MLDEDQVFDFVEQWDTARKSGNPVQLDELCRDFPDLLAIVQQKINAILKFESFHNQPATIDAEETVKSIEEITDLQPLTKDKQGAQGVVFRGRTRELNRDVAVKFIDAGLLRDDDSRARFAVEMEVTGRLQHPGVVPLYGIGQSAGGIPFYYMRYVEGGTLDDEIRDYHAQATRTEQSRTHFRRLLKSFASVCHTIAYAHNRGIVHRDIKPANIMLGRFGETLVVDWGLAVPVERQGLFREHSERSLRPTAGSSQSSFGRGAGTLAYMSPEQIGNGTTTPACDIYSLGATLYKLLTGEAPFSGNERADIERDIMEGRFPKPSERHKGVPKALEAICLCAMSLHPSHRYETATVLADDVERYLDDAAVSVFREPLLRKVARWGRRNRFAAQSVGGAVVLLALVATFASLTLRNSAHREAEARQAAIRSLEAAQVARDHNLRNSAENLARSIGYEMEVRWLLLEAAAEDPALIDAIKSQAEQGSQDDDDRVQHWLERRLLHIDTSVKKRWTSWFITSAAGKQIARVPYARKNIGQSFAHRNYFHGGDHDLPVDGAGNDVRPLNRPHLSTAYRSTVTNHPMVAFSVPVVELATEVGTEDTVLAVISMSFEMGDFLDQKGAMVVDMREDEIEHRPGLVLGHDRLANDRSCYVDPATLTLPDDHRTSAVILEEFMDPVTEKTCNGALTWVAIPGRPDVDAPGLVVIVTE
ncbi:MAG: protein kinase [Pirellulaceae bacterium]